MIRIESLSYRYPESARHALRDVSIHVPKGTCVLVTGPSGSGKTTLCLASAGILAHEYGGESLGMVSIDGRDVTDFEGIAELAGHLGIVFDDPDAQLIFTSVEEEILSALERRGLTAAEVEERLTGILEMTRLTALKDREPHTLSGGQKQRLVLATTLALSPEILILDEPLAELDEESISAIIRILKDLKDLGKTIIIVDHAFSSLGDLVDTLVVIEEGRIIATGTPGSVLKNPRTRQILVPDYSGLKEIAPPVQHNTADPVVSVVNLSHSYGGVPALHGINLAIRKGEFVAIVGENGSGKTTLIKHFNGLLHPTAGSVLVGGKITKSVAIHDLVRTVGMVFQNPDHMFFADTVFDEVAFGVDNLGLPDRDRVVTLALEQAGLSRSGDRYPRWLSRGERQRLAIACVLAMKPEVIVLDEPTSGLDGNEARHVMEMLKELQNAGHTIIVVTHSREIAVEVADRIVTLERGRITTDTRPVAV